MKHIFLTVAVLIAFAAPVKAEEVVTQLPGNATIVTDPDRPTPGVTIRNNESAYYRALFGRDRQQRNYYNANPGAAAPMQTECIKENRTDSSRRACMRRAMREFEHGIND